MISPHCQQIINEYYAYFWRTPANNGVIFQILIQINFFLFSIFFNNIRDVYLSCRGYPINPKKIRLISFG